MKVSPLLLLFSKDQSTKVKNYIVEILSVLVQDGDSLPQEVMDIILSNILEPRKVRLCHSANSKMYLFICVCVCASSLTV